MKGNLRFPLMSSLSLKRWRSRQAKPAFAHLSIDRDTDCERFQSPNAERRKNAVRQAEGAIFAAEHLAGLIREQSRSETFWFFLVTKRTKISIKMLAGRKPAPIFLMGCYFFALFSFSSIIALLGGGIPPLASSFFPSSSIEAFSSGVTTSPANSFLRIIL